MPTSARNTGTSVVAAEPREASIRARFEDGGLSAPLLQHGASSDDDEPQPIIPAGTQQQPVSGQQVERGATQQASSEQEAAGLFDEIQKVWCEEAQNFEASFATLEKKIPRFPRSLQGLKSYSAPKAVAIGPYYRNLKRLRELHKVKEVAADHFVKDSKRQFKDIYKEVAEAAGAATNFYDNISVQGIPDKEFKKMMFLDGCFLMQYMFFCIGDSEKLRPSLLYFFDSNQAVISNDIMLLENQLPWAVIDTLRTFRDVPVLEFVAKMGRTLQVRKHKEEKPFNLDGSYNPPHLLGLLWYYKTRIHRNNDVSIDVHDVLKPMSKTVSAIELAEIGIGLKASKTAMFGDMGIKKVPLFTNIFLAPMLLDQVRACWLVNMVAFEVCMATATGTVRARQTNQVVCSYLAVLAMLMDREEDVHKLRADRIVQGELTNKEMLDFFKLVIKYISGGPPYINIMEEVEDYKVKWWMWIIVYEFFYKNWKTIAALLSAVGVVAGILKTH
ncbi:unnamed protein product [Urochloa humidicola]